MTNLQLGFKRHSITKKVIGYQIHVNGTILSGLMPNELFASSKDMNDFIEDYKIDMRFCEIHKVYDGDIKNPVFVDRYSIKNK